MTSIDKTTDKDLLYIPKHFLRGTPENAAMFAELRKTSTTRTTRPPIQAKRPRANPPPANTQSIPKPRRLTKDKKPGRKKVVLRV